MAREVAKDLFKAGFRVVDDICVDGVRVAVLTGPNKRVCDVLIFDKDETGKPKVLDAFCKQSPFDNFTIMRGHALSAQEPKDVLEVKGRCVEVAVFMGLKYMLTQSGVQMLSEDNEETRKLLIDTANSIPNAVKKLIAKKPELDREDDPLVQACKSWSTEPMDISSDLAALKKEWICRNQVVLECLTTDPKLAKLGVGRAVSMKLMGDRFFDPSLRLAATAIAYARAAYLMCDESSLAFCLGVKYTEEISDCDDYYALKVDEMPEGMGVLDFFLPDGDDFKKAAVVKHMREKAPANELGKVNGMAMSIALDGYLHQDTEETEAVGVLRSIGWEDWFNNGLGMIEARDEAAARLLKSGVVKDEIAVTQQEVFKPRPMFIGAGLLPASDKVMGIVEGAYGVEDVVNELEKILME